MPRSSYFGRQNSGDGVDIESDGWRGGGGGGGGGGPGQPAELLAT